MQWIEAGRCRCFQRGLFQGSQGGSTAAMAQPGRRVGHAPVTLPIGYGDGFPARSLPRQSWCWPAPPIVEDPEWNSSCRNRGLPQRLHGDEVVLIGSQGEHDRCEAVAQAAGTFTMNTDRAQRAIRRVPGPRRRRISAQHDKSHMDGCPGLVRRTCAGCNPAMHEPGKGYARVRYKCMRRTRGRLGARRRVGAWLHRSCKPG